MIIFKPSKIILLDKIKKYSKYLFGITLDAGSGSFNRYGNLFPNIKRIMTLDISEEYNPDILASVESIPLPDESIDSVICTQVLGDIESPEMAIKEFGRIMRVGGILLLSESFINELHDEPYDFWRFTNHTLIKILVKNGFKIIAIEKIGGFFAVKAQLNIRYIIDRLNLLENKPLYFLFRYFINLYGKLMLFLDRIDGSSSGKKFTIGWLVIAKKSIKQ